MDQIVWQQRYREALAKAFSARAPQVRTAYLDLADFYRNKLGDNALV